MAAHQDAFLDLRGLRKSFGSHVALSDLTLSVRRGEFISLLGPSGCGKTTTLHLIAGFLDAEAGDIRLGGQSLAAVPSHRRGAAMVFQNYALFPHMTVFDNVAFGLRMAKAGRAEIRRRVGQALELVRLDGLSARHPRELSGGQQQRVALARALVLEPRLLLLDEPLSNLDTRLRRDLRKDFTEIHRLTGMTTVLVTHDLEEAFSTSDRVAVLSQGKLQQFDTPRSVYGRPATRFVSEFVGHRNVLDGARAGDAGDGLQVGDVRLRAPASPKPSDGSRASYAIPAHALRLAAGADAAATALNTVPGELTSVEYLGATVQFAVRALGRELHGEQPAGPWADTLRAGSRVCATWSVDDMIPLPPA